MVYAQTKICPREWDVKNFWDFEIKTDHLISARRLDLVIKKKKKKKHYQVDFDWKCKWKDWQILGPCQNNFKKAVKLEGDDDICCVPTIYALQWTNEHTSL